MGRGSKLGAAGIVIATAAIGSGASFAQVTESNSSPSVKLNLTTSIVADTNKNLKPVSPGTTVTAAEILSLTVLSETRNQVLRFSASSSLEAVRAPGGGTTSDFTDPLLKLAYSREGANADFSLSADYRSTEVNNSTNDDDLIPEDLIVDRGDLKRYGADIVLRYGTAGPLGLTFSVGTDVRDYTNTTDPDLVDSTRNRFGVSASLRFSPVTQATVSGNLDQRDEDGAANTDRDRTSYSVAVSHELRRALTLTGKLGHSETETTKAGVRTNKDSVFGSLDLRQALPNGALTGGISFEQRSDDPDRVSLSFGRELDLRDGALAVGLTLTQTDDNDPNVLANLRYTKDLPRGALSVALTQSIASNNDDEDVRLSRLAVGYRQSLNSISNLNLSMNVSRSQDGGSGTATGRTRADLTAAYSRELTEDWNLNMGYKRRQYDKSGGDKADSDSVFLTVSRGISLGF